jgi:deoxycytidylate deaminase
MKKIINLDRKTFDILVDIARKSTCHRSKCGSIIINDDKIIGVGYNSQPCNITGECFKDTLSKEFKSDKTCCIHAEQRAIFDALKTNPDSIVGSTLYFIRLDENDNPKRSGDPYCTICSKSALDVGIKDFCLWHHDGWNAYQTDYYNQLSFKLVN